MIQKKKADIAIPEIMHVSKDKEQNNLNNDKSKAPNNEKTTSTAVSVNGDAGKSVTQPA